MWHAGNNNKNFGSVSTTLWIYLVSAQATWRRQRGWLIVYLWSFLSFFISIFIFFYPGTDLSRNLSDRRNFFTDTSVMTQGCQRGSWISKILLTYFIGWKKPLKKHFFTCFSLGDLTFSIVAQKRFYIELKLQLRFGS